MKNVLIIFLIMGLLTSVAGCAKRIEVVTLEKDRVDQDIATGNKGYLRGTPPPEETAKERTTTRKYYQVTLELPPYPEWREYKTTVDTELWGNRGYIYGGPQGIKRRSEKKEKVKEEIVLPDEIETAVEEEEVVLPEEEFSQPSYTEYKVQKNDTLGKISRKFYGTANKWQKIYDFNRDTLKSPNKIYPGQKIKIPQ